MKSFKPGKRQVWKIVQNNYQLLCSNVGSVVKWQQYSFLVNPNGVPTNAFAVNDGCFHPNNPMGISVR